MKNLPLIVIIIIGVCLGAVIFAYEAGFFTSKNNSLAAGLFDWFGTALGGFDCAEKIARCTSDMAYCERRTKEESKRCDNLYNRYVLRCNRYQQRADSYFTRCSEQKTQCLARAERYKQKADRYEGERRERYLQQYQDYLARCEQKYNLCYSRAEQRKERYLQTAGYCRQRAKESRDKCQAKYLERQARRVEQCARRGKRCLERLIDRCGPLVPSI